MHQKIYTAARLGACIAVLLSLTTSCIKPHDDKNIPTKTDSTGTVTPGTLKVTVTTIAGKPHEQGNAEDGNGSNARFWNPTKMAYDHRNHLLYVADGTVIRSVDAQNNVLTYMPLGTISRWSEILDLTLAPGAGGSLYLVTAQQELIRIEPDGQSVKKTMLAHNTYGGNATGTLNSGDHLDGTNGIATGKNGEIYFFNTFWATLHRLVLTAASPAAGRVDPFAGKPLANRSSDAWPFTDGQGEAATFGNNVYDIASDAAGTIYVADAKNHELRMISPTGQVTSLLRHKNPNYGEEIDGQVINTARANGVLQVACTQDGTRVFFSTYGNGGWDSTPALRMVLGLEVFTVVKSQNRWADGSEKTAGLGTVGGLATTPDGKTVYISEPSTKVIRKVVLQ